ncbi:hypothetical protein MMC14_005180 [Varicellaria rhodocarpa]|nr:hypothetical protein [Varicellaria rhodocarpa]
MADKINIATNSDFSYTKEVPYPGCTNKRDGTLKIIFHSKSINLGSILIPLYRPILDPSSIASPKGPNKVHNAITRKGRAWFHLGGDTKIEIRVVEVQSDAGLRYSFYAGGGSFVKVGKDNRCGDLDIHFYLRYEGIDPAGLSLDGEIVFGPKTAPIAKPWVSFQKKFYTIVVNIIE